MFRESIRSTLLSSAVIATAIIAGIAGGENNGVALEREDSEAVAISSELRWQEEELDSAIGVLAQVGNELKETQGQVDEAKAHQRELGRQARKLDAMLEAQKQSSARSHSRFEDQVRVAYKGGELEGLLVLLQGLLGGEGTRGSISATLQTTRLITASNRSIQKLQRYETQPTLYPSADRRHKGGVQGVWGGESSPGRGARRAQIGAAVLGRKPGV